MGVDMSIAVVNRNFSIESLESDLAEYSSIVDYLSSDQYENPVNRHDSYLSCIEDLYGIISEFDPPPAVNTLDLDTFYYATTYYPIFGARGCTAISLIRNSTVMGVKIPEFLESRSSEAAGLWHKLMGHWDYNQKNSHFEKRRYEVLEPPFEFYINDEIYLIEPENNLVGYLQGEELDRLAKEIRPFLPEVNEFYDGLKDKYRRQAEWAAPVELVYALCTCYGRGKQSIMLTHTD